MAHGDQLPSALGGLDARNLSYCQHVTFFYGAVLDMGQSLRSHINSAGSHRSPAGRGLVRHIHHPRPTVSVKMSQFMHSSASDLIHIPRGVALPL